MTNLPFTGKFRVTKKYREKDNRYKAKFHTGIDLVGDTSKDIYSVCDGKVIMAQRYGEYGNAIKVKDNVTGKIFLFAHLSRFFVKVGQTVSRTTKIGYMGNSGNSSGAHLHIEMRTNEDVYGQVEDIAEYMGLPNKIGSYNSSNFQIDSSIKSKYSEGDNVEIKVPVKLTGAKEGADVQVDAGNNNQFWVDNSVIDKGEIYARATIAYIEGNKYIVQVFNRQFWVKEENIVKKLKK